jgi:hypothetical protein
MLLGVRETFTVGTFIFLAALVIVGVSLENLRARRLRRHFTTREPRATWSTRFPNADLREIERFILLFINAFSRLDKCRDQLSPDDGVMELYKLVNKDTPCDELELERWSMDLEDVYHLDLQTFWQDELTLGDVFRLADATSRPGIAK